MVLNFAMIGISEGNGHPYSWSAICNGYDAHSDDCPFDVIPQYLGKQTWPKDQLKGINISGIYCDNLSDAERIAKFSNIKNLYSNLDEIPLTLDGLIVARDDAENHFKYAERFLKAGKPVLLDKPVATSRNQLDIIMAYQDQIFSHSSTIYSHSFRTLINRLREKGSFIEKLTLEAPNSWQKYGIHVVDPLVQIVKQLRFLELKNAYFKRWSPNKFGVSCQLSDIQTEAYVTNTKQPYVKFTIYYRDGSSELLNVTDVFNSFKSLLQEFLLFCNGNAILPIQGRHYYTTIVDIISLGQNND